MVIVLLAQRDTHTDHIYDEYDIINDPNSNIVQISHPGTTQPNDGVPENIIESLLQAAAAHFSGVEL